MAHTPGPWVLGQDGDDSINIEHCVRTIGAASGVIARVTRRISWYSEQMANASLIAAAPDLLAALKAVEWGGACQDEWYVFVPACPFCYTTQSSGTHTEDCIVAIALNKAEPRT